MASRTLRFVTLAGVLAVGACSPSGPSAGSTENPVGGSVTDGSTVTCVADPRVEVYTANLKANGQRGALVFTLVESDPAPPARGSNVLKLKVSTMDGMPSTGEAFASLTMPDHGHTTTVQPVTTFDPSTGLYTIDPAYFFMPGVWRIQIDMYADSDGGAPVDTGVFFFCVQG